MMAQCAESSGRPTPTYHRRAVPQHCTGVVHGHKTPLYDVVHAIGVEHTMDANFTAPELEDEAIPAIFGGDSMAEKRCLIDCGNDVIYFIGPVAIRSTCHRAASSSNWKGRTAII